MGSELLKLLLAGGDSYLSGQKLSEELGVTRAAVWKEITALRKEGFEVESATNRGYRLAQTPDLLWPELVQSKIDSHTKNSIIYLPEVDSTILEANRRILDGAENGTVVLADSQTAGMGRLGRSFLSPVGEGLYLAMILEPRCTVSQLGLLTSIAGLAVCEALENLCSIDAQVKWPNDIIVESRKVCGILTRLVSDAETNTISHAILGIGVNIGQREWPPELADKAISIWQATGQSVSRVDAAGAIITQLNRMLLERLQSPPNELADELRRRSCTLGRQVQVTTPLSSRVGRALEIDESGELVVEFETGAERVSAGEVSVRGLLGYQD